MCDYCSACISICPVDCIEVKEYSIKIDDTICIDCVEYTRMTYKS